MLWIIGAQVLDVESGTFRRTDVGIEGSRIAAVEPTAKPTTSDRTLDATGLHLLPGLIDCHVHLVMRGEDADPAAVAGRPDELIAEHAADAAARTLRAGVTTVRDVGGWNGLEIALRSEIEQGNRLGPRLFLARQLLSAPTPATEYYPGMYQVVRGPDEVRAEVRAQLEAGADLIKVMATGAMLSPEDEDAHEVQLTREELRAAVEEAGSRGARVAAHAHAKNGIADAVEAGVASIEHGTFADEAVHRRMVDKGTFLVPTLSTAPKPDDPILESMPAHIRVRFGETISVHIEAMRLAHRLGVRIAMGTDAGTPGNRHGDNAQECVRMVEEVGMAPEESIRAATINAAELLGRQNDLGRLEPGMLGDLIGVRSNPLQDIRALTRPALVLKGGHHVAG